MNSPNNLGFIHEARYMPRPSPASNMYLVKNPVLISHPSLNNLPSSYGTIPQVHTVNKASESKVKFMEDNKHSARNTPSKRLEYKYFHAEPRTSDISQCSIKQILQTNQRDEVKIKINAINQKISIIIAKLANHDQKLKEILSKQENPQKQEKLENVIWKTVEKQINQTQQHFMVQNRLMSSDIETLKLEVMCFVNKNQLKEMVQKSELNEKSMKDAIKQLDERLNNETEKFNERRKKDFELFEKQIEETRAKLTELVLEHQSRETNNQVCLVKCLSFKILHEMKVYNQGELRWIDLGTGETVYGLDQQGYLLDSQSKYITNNNGQLIQLDASHIEILKKHGLTR